MYAVAWAIGPLLLPFVVIYAASLAGIAWLVTTLPVGDLPRHVTEGFPRRGMAVLSAVMAVLLVGMWVPMILDVAAGRLEGTLIGQTTLVVQALDLGIVVPLSLATAVLVWRRRPVGYLLAATVVVKSLAMAAAITAMVVSAWIVEGQLDIGGLVIFAATAIALVALARTPDPRGRWRWLAQATLTALEAAGLIIERRRRGSLFRSALMPSSDPPRARHQRRRPSLARGAGGRPRVSRGGAPSGVPPSPPGPGDRVPLVTEVEVRAGPLPVDARSTGRARQVFASLPQRYDLLAELLSFGQNRRWRLAMVTAALADQPDAVADVATGTAGVALELLERSGARVVALDLSEAMLDVARRRVAVPGAAGRVALVLGDAQRLPFADGAFDALTFTYLLRYVGDPAATLRELARVVRPGGRIASLDFHVPPAPWWRFAWRGYTRLVLPTAGRLLGGPAWGRVGAFLGPNIEDHYRRHPLVRQVRAWREAGLEDVEVRLMSLGGGVVISGRRRG